MRTWDNEYFHQDKYLSEGTACASLYSLFRRFWHCDSGRDLFGQWAVCHSISIAVSVVFSLSLLSPRILLNSWITSVSFPKDSLPDPSPKNFKLLYNLYKVYSCCSFIQYDRCVKWWLLERPIPLSHVSVSSMNSYDGNIVRIVYVYIYITIYIYIYRWRKHKNKKAEISEIHNSFHI